MFRIDDATAATSLPAPETAATEGYFTEGNPTAGTPATNVRGSWLNMIQEELCSILAAAGITRSKTSYNQVNTALQKMYAPVVGTVRNLAMSVTTVSATATLTADEIIVASALGGQPYKLASFSKTINLATTGAGGMDTGTAPVSGFVALYAIYNPTTQTAALLATNAATKQGNVYGGANMPSGYTASALVSVWPTNASSQLKTGAQIDRKAFIGLVNVYSASATTASYTALSVSTTVPANARTVTGDIACGASVTSNVSLLIAGDVNGSGRKIVSIGTSSSTAFINDINYDDIPILTQQTIYYQSTNSFGTPSYTINVSGYSI